MISANKPILYLDETTCNSGMQVRKTWSNRGYRPKVYRVMTRYNCTIYACISATLIKKPVLLLTKKCTNTTNYLEFLKQIIQKLSPCALKPYLVFDGHSAHLSKKAQELVNQHFHAVRLPPQSCEFNSAEGIFALGKRYLRKLLTAEVPTSQQ